MLHGGHPLADAEVSDADILGGNQAVLVKKGHLHAAASHIKDGGAFFDDPVELVGLSCDGLVIQETLFGVA